MADADLLLTSRELWDSLKSEAGLALSADPDVETYDSAFRHFLRAAAYQLLPGWDCKRLRDASHDSLRPGRAALRGGSR